MLGWFIFSMNLGNTLWNENDQNPLDPPLAKGGKGGFENVKN